MQKNKLSSYFLYAIGEIVLVVIGILIAVSINNWNEGRKNKLLEAGYYCQFLENVNQDEKQIEELIIKTKDRLKAVNEYVRMLQNGNPKKLDLGNQIYKVIKGNVVQFEAENTAFPDLTVGSNLNLIRDKKVKEAINDYYFAIAGLNSIIIQNNELVNRRYQELSSIHEDGWLHSRMKLDRFLKGMEPDVYDNMKVDFEERINADTKETLLDYGLRFISTVYRRMELYELMLVEVKATQVILESKCNDSTN